MEASKLKSAVVRFWRIMVWSALGFLVISPVIYVAEDYRNRAMWERFRAEWEAKGEVFEVEPLLPEPVASEDNFAESPLFEEYFKIRKAHPGWFMVDGDDPAKWESMGRLQVLKDAIDRMPLIPTEVKRWRNRDLPSGWQAARSRPVSVPSQNNRNDRDEIRLLSQPEAARRLLAFVDDQWAEDWASLHSHSKTRNSFVSPESYTDLSIPYRFDWVYHLSELGRHGLDRCAARLALGESEAAFDEWQLSWQFVNYAKTGASFGYWVSQDLSRRSLQPLWEGASRHQWSDQQLQQAQLTLKTWSEESAERLLRSIRLERNLFLDATVYPERRQIDQFRMDGIDPLVFRIAPEGWILRNALTACQMLQEFGLTDPSGNVETSVIHLDRIGEWTALNDKINQSHKFYYSARGPHPPFKWHPYRWLAFYCGSSPNIMPYAHADLQDFDVVIAGLGCERFYLKHGAYPISLEQLVPDFLEEVPKDRSTGNPLAYAQRSDGSPAVWAVGPSGNDDGGNPHEDRDFSDTVWQYQLSDELLEIEQKLEAMAEERGERKE